jgi:hypothetical protein
MRAVSARAEGCLGGRARAVAGGIGTGGRLGRATHSEVAAGWQIEERRRSARSRKGYAAGRQAAPTGPKGRGVEAERWTHS